MKYRLCAVFSKTKFYSERVTNAMNKILVSPNNLLNENNFMSTYLYYNTFVKISIVVKEWVDEKDIEF